VFCQKFSQPIGTKKALKQKVNCANISYMRLLMKEKIYDENEIEILSENTKIMQLWIKNNPKKAEHFLQFKNGFEAKSKE